MDKGVLPSALPSRSQVTEVFGYEPTGHSAYLPPNKDSIVDDAAQVEAGVGVKGDLSRVLPLCIRGRALRRLQRFVLDENGFQAA
jgi:hypothetical protein